MSSELNEKDRLDAAQAWLEDAQEAVSKALFHLIELKKEKGIQK